MYTAPFTNDYPGRFQDFCRRRHNGLVYLGMAFVVGFAITMNLVMIKQIRSDDVLMFGGACGYIGMAFLVVAITAHKPSTSFRRYASLATVVAVLAVGLLLSRLML